MGASSQVFKSPALAVAAATSAFPVSSTRRGGLDQDQNQDNNGGGKNGCCVSSLISLPPRTFVF